MFSPGAARAAPLFENEIEGVGLVRGGDADDGRKRRRVFELRAAVVSRGRDEQGSFGLGVLRGGRQRGVLERAAEAGVDHTGSVVGRPEDCPRHVRGEAASVGAQRLERHHRAAPAVAGNADAVVAGGRDHACDRRPVAVVVDRVGVAVDEVVPGDDASGEVGRARVDAGVHDRDHRARHASRAVPRRRGVGLDRRPLRRPERVVRRAERVHAAIGRRPGDGGSGAESVEPAFVPGDHVDPESARHGALTRV